MTSGDGSAVIGILVAAGGVALHQVSGSRFGDGLASVVIGLLLTGVAYVLGAADKGLLIGR